MAIQKEKTSIDNFLYYGVDPKNRTIHFGVTPDDTDEGEFTTFSNKTVEIAIRGLSRMRSEDAKVPVSIYVGSGGGDAFACLYLIDYILSCPFQVKFYGGGLIASAATLLMSVCDERYLFPNTTMMIHEHSFGLNYEKFSDQKIEMKENEVFFEKLCNIYAANSFMDKAFYKSLLGAGRDVWMTPQEAINIGLADAIVAPVKRGNLRRMRAQHLSNPVEEKLKKTVTDLNKRILRLDQTIEITVKMPPKDMCDPNVIIGEPDLEGNPESN